MQLHLVPIGPNAPRLVNVVIEIPKGTRNKYEYDEKLDIIRLDRVLYSSVFYPAEYGFIPETRSEDGDHLDTLVLLSDPTFAGCVVPARPIGALNMEDEAGRDAKIISVANDDPRYADVSSIDDIDAHSKKEIQHFFEVYKQLEKKPVKVTGWLSKEDAYRLIKKAQETFSHD